MGLYSGIGKASTTGGGNFLGAGMHKLRVEKCLTKNSDRSKGRTFSIVEFEVVESNKEDHEPGSKRSWVVDMAWPNALGNVKALLLAIFGLDDGQLDDASFEQLAEATFQGEENPAKDAVVMAEGITIKTRGKGEDFTRFDWEAVSPPPVATQAA